VYLYRRNSLNKVAIIGAGYISGDHYPGWQRAEDAELSIVVDINQEQAKKRAAEWGGIAWETDYKKILNNPEITICDICLPHHLHARVTIDCLLAGKHVLLEKPIAMTISESIDIIEARKKSGKMLMIAENWYFAPVVTKAAELIGGGAIGEVYSIRANLDYPGMRSWPKEKAYVRGVGWREQAAQAGGGVMVDGGIHTLSVARMFMGEVDTVWGIEGKQAWKEQTGLEDTFYTMLRFKSGAAGVFHFTDASGWDRCHFDFTLLGTDGVIEFDIWTGVLKVNGKNITTEYRVPAYGGFIEEIAHFMTCVRTGKEPYSSGPDQTRSLALLLAAYESARMGGVGVQPREIEVHHNEATS
jgi:predicted dehydrogenase